MLTAWIVVQYTFHEVRTSVPLSFQHPYHWRGLEFLCAPQPPVLERGMFVYRELRCRQTQESVFHGPES